MSTEIALGKFYVVLPSSWWGYILCVIVFAVIVRFLVLLFRTIELKCKPSIRIYRSVHKIRSCENNFLTETFWKGFGTKDFWECFLIEAPGDHFLNFYIGFFELLAYPILLASGHPLFIGAWLTFKTVHRVPYKAGIDRGLFARYLFGNALVLFCSFVLLLWSFQSSSVPY